MNRKIQLQRQELSPDLPFEEVLEQVQPMITFILKKCHVYKNIDDYRHLATIAVWEAWKNANTSKGAFSSYIYTTIEGKVKNELTRETKDLQRFTVMEDEKINFMRTNKEKEKIEQHHEKLDILFSSLSKEELELLSLLYIEGYSYEETAKRLNCSIETMKKRRTRLVKKIRQQHIK